MITGGLAAIIDGEPRLTNDVDLLLQLTPGGAAGCRRGVAPGAVTVV